MKLSKNAERLNKVIEADRLNAGAFASDLIVCDLKGLLSDYVELTNAPTVEIVPDENGYKITVTATASQIKSFRRID